MVFLHLLPGAPFRNFLNSAFYMKIALLQLSNTPSISYFSKGQPRKSTVLFLCLALSIPCTTSSYIARLTPINMRLAPNKHKKRGAPPKINFLGALLSILADCRLTSSSDTRCALKKKNGEADLCASTSLPLRFLFSIR